MNPIYTQYHKGLSVVLLTSILLQGCGSGNTYLAHEREVPNSSGSIKQKALASEQLREPYIQRVPEENSDWTPTLHQEQQTAEQSATPSARPTSQVGKGKPNRRTSSRRHQKHLASSPAQTFTTVQGEQVMFHQTQGQWQATVTNPVTSQKNTLDVKCAPGYTVETLAHWDPSYQKHRLHVYEAQGVVYLGPLGLAGGMMGDGEEKQGVLDHEHPKSGEGQDESATRGTKEQAQVQHAEAHRENDDQVAAGVGEPTPAQKEFLSLKKAIEQDLALIVAPDEQDARPQVVNRLLMNVEHLLGLEQGEEESLVYIKRLQEDHRLNWGDPQQEEKARTRLNTLLAYASCVQALRSRVSESLRTESADKEQLLAVLAQLAALHQEQGRLTGDLSHYTDAAVLYQHGMSVCEKEGEAYTVQREASLEGLARVRAAILTSARGEEGEGEPSVSALQEEIERDKLALHELREEARGRVAALEEAERSDEAAYIEGSRALFTDIAGSMAAFLSRLYEESEQELGPAPCKYTVMGLGSMALKQMTPYSDLEFAILIEDNTSEGGLEEHRAYFRRLSHLVHFKVINLGETVTPRSKYQVSLDHLGKKGVNFDLGGKTPLGRQDKAHLVKPYELIQPVREMIRYLRNEGQRMEHMDKLLPFILEATCHIHGDDALYATYVREKARFLKEGQTEQGFPVYKARARQKLLEGVVERDYRGGGPGVAGRLQQGDMADFEPRLSSEDVGRMYDVKQEIYRLPDRLLYRMAMYYGLLPESSWDAVVQLVNTGIINNEEAARHLQYAASFATLLRLKTYTHHGQQKEGMAVPRSDKSEAEQQQALGEMFRLPSEALQAGGSFFKYYYTALPLHERMEEFFLAKWEDFSPSEEETFFHTETFYNNSERANGDIYMRLMQYTTAKTCYETAQKHHSSSYADLAQLLDKLGMVCEALGSSGEGLRHKEEALAIRRTLYTVPHPDLARSLNNVAVSYKASGQLDQAFHHAEQALAMMRALYATPHPYLARSLSSVGLIYKSLGRPEEAMRYQKEALDMQKKLYKAPHPVIAVSLSDIGLSHMALGQVYEGLRCSEEALEMRKLLYAGDHPEILSSLLSMGAIYEILDQLSKALDYKKEALAMAKSLYQGDHPDIARAVSNVGETYYRLRQPIEGLRYQKEALAMMQSLYKESHPNLAHVLSHVGASHIALGQVLEGLSYGKKALAMRESLYTAPHPDIADSLQNVGNAYCLLYQFPEGLGYQEKALGMRKALHPDLKHPAFVDMLSTMGNTYDALGQVSEGLSCREEALKVCRSLYEKDHSNTAKVLGTMGTSYFMKLGKPQQALVCCNEGVAILQRLHYNHPDIEALSRVMAMMEQHQKQRGVYEEVLSRNLQDLEECKVQYSGQDHPDLARSFDAVGRAYLFLGDTVQALKHGKDALDMFKRLYPGQNHPELAGAFNTVGKIYLALGDASKTFLYCREATDMFQSLNPSQEHPGLVDTRRTMRVARQMITKPLIQHCAKIKQVLATAMEASTQNDVEQAIRSYEESSELLNMFDMLPSETREMLSGELRSMGECIYHNLGCMHHVAALTTAEEAAAQTHLNSAAVAFETAVAASGEDARAGLYTEYGNFLLATAQPAAAYNYLNQAVVSGDAESELGYSALERATVHSTLQTRIDQEGKVSLRSIDYAYFLLIHHYDTFVQAGIPLDRTQADYLLAFKASIEQRAGEEVKEKQDEVGYYLLGSLYQALGNEEAAQEAFAMGQAITLAAGTA